MDDHTEGLIKARSMTHPEENGNGLPPRLIEKIFRLRLDVGIQLEELNWA